MVIIQQLPDKVYLCVLHGTASACCMCTASQSRGRLILEICTVLCLEKGLEELGLY